MPKYRMMSNYGYDEAINNGTIECESQEAADEAAFDKACERIDTWAELIEEDTEL